MVSKPIKVSADPEFSTLVLLSLRAGNACRWARQEGRPLSEDELHLVFDSTIECSCCMDTCSRMPTPCRLYTSALDALAADQSFIAGAMRIPHSQFHTTPMSPFKWSRSFHHKNSPIAIVKTFEHSTSQTYYCRCTPQEMSDILDVYDLRIDTAEKPCISSTTATGYTWTAQETDSMPRRQHDGHCVSKLSLLS